MKFLSLTSVSKSFAGKKVLDNVSFSIGKGEIVSIVGPNGCGKTTLVNLLAGIDMPDSGSISINGFPPAKAKIGVVFQNYSQTIFPWKTLSENIALAIGGKVNENKRALFVARKFAQKIGLVGSEDAYPYAVSGGMQQLACIARAWAMDPDLFVLDESFSALDYYNKLHIESLVAQLWRESKKTVICMSHDLDTAVFVSTKIIVLSKRPASIKRIVPVACSWPRTIDTRLHKSFTTTKNTVLRALKSEL